MLKRSIQWHEECLRNLKVTVETYRAEAARLEETYNRANSDRLMYEQQIERAKSKGITEFDREKFGKRRQSLR